jgi:hypothetical protein
MAIAIFEVEAVGCNYAKVQDMSAPYNWEVDILTLALAHEATDCP